MISTFGNLADGREVHAITLGSPDLLQAQVLTYGGILRELTFFSHGTRHSLVVSLPDLDAYVRDTAFVGVVAGRVANRIAGARFSLNGKEHRLTANDGPNHLHGGRRGFGKRLWRIVEHDGLNRLRLALHSPAGEEGYPGNLDVAVDYVVEGPELRVRFEARADQDTPFSPTFHPYFKISDDSELLIHGDEYLPVSGSDMLPSGEVAHVDGTPFDFRAPRSVAPPLLAGHSQLAFAQGYDHCWLLRASREFDAKLRISGLIELTISSDCPGIQFYGGQHSAALRSICLEPEGLPNAVNMPAFEPFIVKRAAEYATTFKYRLGRNASA